MSKKEYRAISVNSTDINIKNIVAKLTNAGISDNDYRINYFNINAEIVSEKTLSNKIKNIIK